MKQLNWNDKLLGKEITPESWPGGICAMQTSLVKVMIYLSNDGFQPKLVREDGDWDYLQNYVPVYPPIGWNGKSEAEIWAEMVGTGCCCIFGDHPNRIEVNAQGTISRCWNGNYNFEIPDPAALIRAIRKGMRMQLRVKEGTQ